MNAIRALVVCTLSHASCVWAFRAHDDPDSDLGELEGDEASPAVQFEIANVSNSSIGLTQGMYSTTVLWRAPEALKHVVGYQVIKLGDVDVSNVPPWPAMKLWRQLSHSGNKTISVTVMPVGVNHGRLLQLLLGIAPALVAWPLVLCLLPPVLVQLLRQNALTAVPSSKTPDGEAEEHLARGHGKWIKEKAPIPFESVEERLQISMEPSQTLKNSGFASVAGKKYLLHVAVLYPMGAFFTDAYQMLPLVKYDWKVVAVQMACSLLQVLRCGFVFYGLRKASKSALVSFGARCPSGINMTVKEMLEAHLFRNTVLPYLPVALCLICSIFLFSVLSPVISLFHGRLGHTWLLLLASTTELLNSGLLEAAFFKFILDVSCQARTVQAYVQASSRVVLEVHNPDKTMGADGSCSLDKARMKALHVFVVKLSVEILPCLDAVAMPAVVVVASGFLRSLLGILMQLAGTNLLSNPLMSLASLFVLGMQVLPLVVCLLPLTAVSDAFDELRAALNALRAVSDPEDDKSIRMIESYIEKANNGQGLGFVLFGTGMVVNKRVLTSIGVKMVAGASVLIAFVEQFFEISHQG